jgi:LPXTG-site transpeptidase (sortase) family protein
VRRWLVVAVLCLAVAVGVPAAWYLTRPGADEGVRVAGVGVTTPTRTPAATAPPASPGAPAPPLPSLTARPAVPGAEATRAPVRLRIPTVGVDAIVLPVGVDRNGVMVVPRDVRQVGWYRFGPAPGDPAGAAVITGHVDTGEAGAGALFPLRSARVGDAVRVTLVGDRTVTYRVVGKQTIVKQRLPVEQLFARDGAPRLVLITCGGPFLPELSSYRDNLVVVAVPDGDRPGPGGTP